jgi:hypothetical protein
MLTPFKYDTQICEIGRQFVAFTGDIVRNQYYTSIDVRSMYSVMLAIHTLK